MPRSLRRLARCGLHRTRSAEPITRGFLAALLCAAAAHAQTDQDLARRAVLSHQSLPFGRILDRVRMDHPGRLLDTRLGDGEDGLLYTLRVLQGDGRIGEWSYDARTADPFVEPIITHPPWTGGG